MKAVAWDNCTNPSHGDISALKPPISKPCITVDSVLSLLSPSRIIVFLRELPCLFFVCFVFSTLADFFSTAVAFLGFPGGFPINQHP